MHQTSAEDCIYSWLPVGISVELLLTTACLLFQLFVWRNYRVAQKKLAPFVYALILPNIKRCLKLFHCQNQEKICNNSIAKDPTTP